MLLSGSRDAVLLFAGTVGQRNSLNSPSSSCSGGRFFSSIFCPTSLLLMVGTVLLSPSGEEVLLFAETVGQRNSLNSPSRSSSGDRFFPSICGPASLQLMAICLLLLNHAFAVEQMPLHRRIKKQNMHQCQ